MHLDTTFTIRGGKPRVPFEKIAARILPKDYSLSLVLCGDSLARAINKKARKKDYAPNVLSFPISKNEGEIFIDVRKAEREARSLNVTAEDRVAHLVVHGVFHLMGLDHGATMERKEREILRAFGFRLPY